MCVFIIILGIFLRRRRKKYKRLRGDEKPKPPKDSGRKDRDSERKKLAEKESSKDIANFLSTNIQNHMPSHCRLKQHSVATESCGYRCNQAHFYCRYIIDTTMVMVDIEMISVGLLVCLPHIIQFCEINRWSCGSDQPV